MNYETPRKPDIGRAVIASHPKYEEVAQQCLAELRDADMKIPVHPEILRTSADINENIETILDNLKENDAVALVGGDGTRLKWAEAVMRLKAPQHPKGVIKLASSLKLTSAKGGNGRDAGRAEHGRHHMNGPLSWILNNAVELEAYAMRYDCARAIADGQQLIGGFALSYIGIGETAETTTGLTDPKYTNGKPILRDLKLGLRSWMGDTEFDLIDEGERRRLADITFAKGHCMAKVATLDVEYGQPRILVCRTGTSLLARTEAAARYLTGLSRQEYVDSHRIRIKSPVRIHIDGDPPIPLAVDSVFEVGLAPQTYTILSTRARHPVVDPLNEYAF
jgi:hypothetical protein